jgi:hypothetical protein
MRAMAGSQMDILGMRAKKELQFFDAHVSTKYLIFGTRKLDWMRRYGSGSLEAHLASSSFQLRRVMTYSPLAFSQSMMKYHITLSHHLATRCPSHP